MSINDSIRLKLNKLLRSDLLCYLICMLLPAILMLGAYAVIGIYPFGQKSLLLIDMDSQFVDFYQGITHMLTGETSPIFSWHMALGNNYWGLFAYYISSPLSLITAIFSGVSITNGILVMTLLKIGLSGLTFSVFARKVFKVPKAILPGLATAYALMSYNVIYAMMPMWLDTVAILPMMALGVEILIQKNRKMPLIAWTTLCVICNYYTAYMAVVFIILWFLYRITLFTIEKQSVSQCIHKCKWFAISMIAAGGLSAFMLLPAYMSLLSGRVVSSGTALSSFRSLSLRELGAKMLWGAYDGYRYDAAPYVYCGIAIIIVCLLFFIKSKAKVQEKIASGCLGMLVILSLCLPIGNGLFHMFEHPNWFMYRYAFIASFYLVALASRVFSEDIRNERHDKASTTRVKLSKFSLLALSVLICFDMFTNASSLLITLDNETSFRPHSEWNNAYLRSKPIIDEIANIDNGFYRIDKEYQRSYNDSISLGYNSISHYSSAYKRSTLDFLKSLGMWQNWFRSSGRGSTIVVDSILSVKYRLTRSDVLPGYARLFTSNSVSAFENPYVFPVAVVSELLPLESENPFMRQNILARSVGSIDADVFIPAPYYITNSRVVQSSGDNGKLMLMIEAVTNGPLFLYMNTERAPVNAVVYSNSRYVGYTYEDYSLNNMFSLGVFSPGDVVEVLLDTDERSFVTDGYLVYQLNETLLSDAAMRARENGLSVDKVYSNGISGTLNVPDGGWLFTSIPFDDGWSVRIDGKRVETAVYADALLSVYVPANSNRVTFRFISPGLIWGLIISGLTATACILWWKFGIRNSELGIDNTHMNSIID